MKIIGIFLLVVFCNFNAYADTDKLIKMYGKEKYGFNQPKYVNEYSNNENNNKFNLLTLADPENFPISSLEQGSIFSKIFSKLNETEDLTFIFKYDKSYTDAVVDFERGKLKEANAHFGVYYKETPYSQNEYIYPAFFENRIYIISSAQTKITLNNKTELKNLKGVYVEKDRLPEYTIKEFLSLGMVAVEDWSKAFELLLTGKADYIAASYYPSLIEAYKMGLRNYVTYSKEPVWRIAMFIRVTPNLIEHPKIAKLKTYLKSAEYKKIKEDAFAELIKIYEQNTQGIVPPTFIKAVSETENLQDSQNIE